MSYDVAMAIRELGKSIERAAKTLADAKGTQNAPAQDQINEDVAELVSKYIINYVKNGLNRK